MAVKYELKSNNKIIKCVDFDSFTDQLRCVYGFIKEDPFNTIKEVNHKDNFYGKHSLNETLDGMNYGFSDSTRKFLNLVGELKVDKDVNNGVFMDTEGFAYDMGAVVNGEPECCVNFGTPKPTPCINIIVDISWSGGISANRIFNRGVAITNLVHTLILNGCIVDLHAFRYNMQEDMDIMFTTKIDTRTLSMANIAFMCSPEYFRKMGWITTDFIRERPSEWGRGRSEASDFLLRKIKKEKIFFIGGDFCNPSIVTRLETPVSASNYIIELFNKFCKENKIAISIDNGKS